MKDDSPEQKPINDQEKLQKTQHRLERLSHILDDAFTIPVLNIKIGWDAIIGLIPVVGDIVGALLSFYLVFQATKLKLGAFTILRMLINIGIELLLGIVPVLGDFFDVTWRANRKNYHLIERHLDKKLPPSAGRAKARTSDKDSRADQRSGLRTAYQLVLALLCGSALYYLFVQWQAGDTVRPEHFYPSALFERL